MTGTRRPPDDRRLRRLSPVVATTYKEKECGPPHRAPGFRSLRAQMRTRSRLLLRLAVGHDRQEADRQREQLLRPVHALAVELQGVTRAEGVRGVAVSVDHLALEHEQ